MIKSRAILYKVIIVSAALLVISKSLWHTGMLISSSGAGEQISTPTQAPTLAMAARDIARLHWFGVNPSEETDADNDASLDSQFEIKGISLSEDNNVAGAFINQKDNNEHWYRVGNALPGGAGTLKAVYSDHIIVNRGGRNVNLTVLSNNNNNKQ
jgi:type II secretory pathway component PulC